MTIYSNIKIAGSLVNEVTRLVVKKRVGDDNFSSNFNADVDNRHGMNTGTWNLGDEVTIYADKDNNPPGSLIFTGILENIDYPSRPNNERMRLSGRDYTARLIDRNILPEVYTSLPAGSIVKDVISKYTDDITTNNVSDSPTTIDRIAFNQKPVFDGVKRLSDLAQYTFYVDNDKDLHFEEKSTVSSNQTFGSGNVTHADINERRDEVFNEVWVYGERYMDGTREEHFQDGVGSVFTLAYKPHATQVLLGSPITTATIQRGGVFGFNQIPASGTDYLVDYDDRKIVFVSGTSLGYSSIPSSGTAQMITVNYNRSLPIIKTGRNSASIGEYGLRTKVIQDKDIKDPDTAQQLVEAELAKSSLPEKECNLEIKGVMDVIPGQTCVVNLPQQDIDNQTYDIKESVYDFSPRNNREEKVLSVRVNKRLANINDTIKGLVNAVKDLQAGDIGDPEILSRFEFTTGSIGFRQSGCEVQTRSIAGDTLIWGNDGFGIWGTGKWGDSATTSFILGNPQAGVLGTSVLGTQASAWTTVWSGCYPQ